MSWMTIRILSTDLSKLREIRQEFEKIEGIRYSSDAKFILAATSRALNYQRAFESARDESK